MDASSQLDSVVRLLTRMEIEVRLEHLGGQEGGLCMLHGRRVAFVDLDADVATRLDSALRALRACPELDKIYVSPAIRELIEQIGS